MSNLSSRYKHEEHEVLVRQVDRLNKGDISGWAHATSKPFGTALNPRRPEVGRQTRAFTPVRDVGAIVPLAKPSTGPSVPGITLPGASQDESVRMEMEKLDLAISSREARQRMENQLASLMVPQKVIAKKAIQEAIAPIGETVAPGVVRALAETVRPIEREDEGYKPGPAENRHKRFRLIGSRWVQ